MKPDNDTNIPLSILTLDALSDREISTAAFLMVCALAEKLTGQSPCLMVPNGRELPTFIHGADCGVAWLPQKTPNYEPVPVSGRKRAYTERPIRVAPLRYQPMNNPVMVKTKPRARPTK